MVAPSEAALFMAPWRIEAQDTASLEQTRCVPRDVGDAVPTGGRSIRRTQIGNSLPPGMTGEDMRLVVSPGNPLRSVGRGWWHPNAASERLTRTLMLTAWSSPDDSQNSHGALLAPLAEYEKRTYAIAINGLRSTKTHRPRGNEIHSSPTSRTAKATRNEVNRDEAD